MLAFISDANILIDVEVGGLIAPMFSLVYPFAVPDVLFFEELAEHHAHWRDMGLIVQSLPPEGVARVQALSQKYKHPSRNDLFALTLAEQAQCPLLRDHHDPRCGVHCRIGSSESWHRQPIARRAPA
jgi:hypothetical protein